MAPRCDGRLLPAARHLAVKAYIERDNLVNKGHEIHELCLDRSRTVFQANCHFLAGDHAADADARAIIALLDLRIRERIHQ
jgi:hypothetical protein